MRSTGGPGGPPALSGSAVRAYLESFITEDGSLAAARERAQEWGCTPIGPASGAEFP